jgi:hypothetical protein
LRISSPHQWGMDSTSMVSGRVRSAKWPAGREPQPGCKRCSGPHQGLAVAAGRSPVNRGPQQAAKGRPDSQGQSVWVVMAMLILVMPRHRDRDVVQGSANPDVQGFQGKGSVREMHPLYQTTPCCAMRSLTLPYGRIRFAFRYGPFTSYRFLQTLPLPATPSESSLTCDSDCLPPGRGDACLTQAGFARHAGQTKKPRSNSTGADHHRATPITARQPGPPRSPAPG